VAEPKFFSEQWASAVRDALAAGPSAEARSGKLQEYWDFFELIKGMYPASWALGCRNPPAALGEGPAYLYLKWGGGTVTDGQIIRPDDPPPPTHLPIPPSLSPFTATYVLGMDYADWKALHEGYDAQRTVMYRKIMLEDGDLLEFFKTIYFFVECLAIVAAVPADYPALATRRRSNGPGPSS